MTEREIEVLFAEFIKAIGGRVAENPNDMGGYFIYQGPNGREIHKVTNKAGGTDQPFGYQSFTRGQLIQFIHAGFNIVREMNTNGHNRT